MLKVASISPEVEIGNPFKNIKKIKESVSRPEVTGCSIIVFPELCITGYTCGDLFFQDTLISEASAALLLLAEDLKDDNRLMAVGVPLLHKGQLFNCAALICSGKIIGVVPKTFIPNYQEFYEKRWFVSGKNHRSETIVINGFETLFGTDLIFRYQGIGVGVEICEDLWVPSPPSCSLSVAGAEIILNLSATDDNIGKYDYIKNLVSSQSARCRCGYVYSSAGMGESSTDLVFSGINIIACNGLIENESKRFSRDFSYAAAWIDVQKLRQERRKYSTFYEGTDSDREFTFVPASSSTKTRSLPLDNVSFAVNPHPFIPSDVDKRNESCSEIINIQSWGLSRRLEAANCKNLVVGISGGLDSTLALLIAHNAFRNLNLDVKGIVGVTMPSDATSHRTRDNAGMLMKCLGVSSLEIPIKKSVDLHFEEIGHDPGLYDVVYENSQARERTQILMDLANKFSGMVLGTGDMSEMALGWCTYNGDHMSMYNVNAGVPKTLVRHLVRWFADMSQSKELKTVLTDIIDTPISPELIPSGSKEKIGQKTEDLVGPYELHDFFMFHMLRNGFSPRKIFYLANLAFQDRFSSEEIKKWLLNFYRRFFSQQFKRSCMPDGPKIGSVCLSPRGDWRMPSDASARAWLNEVETL